MGFERLMATSQRLSISVEALAALGAELKLRGGTERSDRRIGTLLHEVLGALEPRLLEDLDPKGKAAALALIETVFRQAMDLLENPARAAGWSYADPVVLETQGQLSRVVVRGIAALAAQQPELRAALLEPGALLDVGTGAGWLAIEAASTWPALRVVGIDPWEPALELARRNVAASQVASRVELRSQRVEELDETAAFTLAWLPGPFISWEVAERALPRIHRALEPGGWLIFGLNAQPPGALGAALTNLRVVRSGGHPWNLREIEGQLRAQGYERIESFSPDLPIRLVAARRGWSGST